MIHPRVVQAAAIVLVVAANAVFFAIYAQVNARRGRRNKIAWYDISWKMFTILGEHRRLYPHSWLRVVTVTLAVTGFGCFFTAMRMPGGEPTSQFVRRTVPNSVEPAGQAAARQPIGEEHRSGRIEYEVVFDVRSSHFRYWPVVAVFALVPLALLACLVWAWRGPIRQRRGWPILLACLASGGVASVCWQAPLVLYRQYSTLRERLELGQYVAVEGIVTDFDPLPPGGNGLERFRVGSHRYEYSDFTATVAFNRSRTKGGPIRSGLRVRIADVDGAIARLDVERQ